MADSPVIVLVHGAWHGAWCWAALQAELDRRGLASYAVDLPGHGASTRPLGDLDGDAQLVADTIDLLDSDVVLVGHSYGGMVITEAATRTNRVRHLVYVAAFVPDAGQSVMDVLGAMPPAEVAVAAAMVRRDDATSVIDPAGAVAAFYGACPPEVAAAAIRRLSPQPSATFTQPVSGAPWRTIPSTYIRCAQDGALHPDHQTSMSRRCGRVETLETDHSPFVSAVVPTAEIIASATSSSGGAQL